MNFRKRVGIIGTGLVLVGAAGFSAAGTAHADSGGWATFNGIGSNWHCSSTAPIAEEAGLLAQECVIVSGTNFQAALVVRASQKGYFQGANWPVFSGVYQNFAEHDCEGNIAAGTNKVCFTQTLAGDAGNAVQGYAAFTGSSQIWSPSVTL
jgi:hypothetical protein